METPGPSPRPEVLDHLKVSRLRIALSRSACGDCQIVTAIPVTDCRSLNLINSNEFEKVSDLNYQIYKITSSFSLVLVSIKKIYQTLETVFYHIPKLPKVGQKKSAARRLFHSTSPL